MKKFKFSLQKVLDVKESEKKIIQKNLTSLRAKVEIEEQNYFEIETKISAKMKLLKSLESTKFTSAEYMQIHDFIKFLEKEKENSQKKIDRINIQIDRVIEQLKEKLKEEKSLGILKEKRYNFHKKTAKRREQAFNDEISIFRKHRQVENE